VTISKNRGSKNSYSTCYNQPHNIFNHNKTP
jgi:hypothetical protein